MSLRAEGMSRHGSRSEVIAGAMSVDPNAMVIELDRSSLGDDGFSLRAKQIGVCSPGKKISVDGIGVVLDLIRVHAQGGEFRAGGWEFDGRGLEFHVLG